MGRMLSHEERLELTQRKMAFREAMKHAHEVPAYPGMEELKAQYPKYKGERVCPQCGGPLERWESCYRCKQCGTSLC